MANTKVTTRVIADDAITSDKLASGLTLGGDTTLSGHVDLANDKRIRLGDSDELQLHAHNSGYGHIQNTGTLYIDAEVLEFRTDNDDLATALTLNAAQLATFANGITATAGTGTVTATTFSGALSGTIASATTATTQSASDNTTKVATTAFVGTAISNLVDSSPSALNTLNELAAALGDDANFSTTVTNSIATKLPLAGGTLTGNLVVDIGNSGNDSFIELKNTGYTGNITSLRQNADSTRAELNSTERPIFIQAGSGGSASNAEVRLYANQQLGFTLDANKKATFGGNIELTGGGTISSPSVSGGEGLGLQAAGTITVLIDSNGNSGDDQFFKVQKHSSTDLFTVKETGEVAIPSGSLNITKVHSQLTLTDSDDSKFVLYSYSGGKLIVRNNSTNTTANQFTLLENGNFGIGTINPTAPLDVSREIGSNIAQTSTYNYSSNRNWAMNTNGYGSSNWGGWSLEQSTSAGGTPSVVRIGVHLNGNVGINMGGDASSGLTDINPATALHVGGDVTVGSADSVGTGAASAIRFVNDNERSRITSNYASGGGGQMGFWTDSTGGTLLQRAYIKNDGTFNLNHNLKLQNHYWNGSDVMKAYSLAGPSGTTLTRTINVNTFWNFAAQGGAFMYMLHGWAGDSAVGMVHWRNAGNSTQVIVDVFHNEFVTPTGLTSVVAAKGTGDYDIDMTLTGTHTNSHGWYWKVWA